MTDNWNKCNICGQFIAYQEFADETAVNRLVNPDAYGSEELWDTYHKRCENESTEER
jgi:hypothetical protein